MTFDEMFLGRTTACMGEPYGAFMYKVKPTEHGNLRTWGLKMIVSSVYYNNVQIVAFFPGVQ